MSKLDDEKCRKLDRHNLERCNPFVNIKMVRTRLVNGMRLVSSHVRPRFPSHTFLWKIASCSFWIITSQFYYQKKRKNIYINNINCFSFTLTASRRWWLSCKYFRIHVKTLAVVSWAANITPIMLSAICESLSLFFSFSSPSPPSNSVASSPPPCSLLRRLFSINFPNVSLSNFLAYPFRHSWRKSSQTEPIFIEFIGREQNLTLCLFTFIALWKGVPGRSRGIEL